MFHEEPLDERTFRQAICAYYALVSFMDDQIGQVLRALDEAGLTDSTRILYTNDHGDMVGKHGLWYKSVMYEDSAGVSMIVAGPDVPAGKVSETNVTLVDVFPTALQATGVEPAPEDADLPGLSLLDLANEDGRRSRVAFSEYHSSMSASASFMLRDDRYKLIYYVGMPRQLFDLEADPDERHNLADDPAHAATVGRLEAALRAICDPEEIDRIAKADQHAPSRGGRRRRGHRRGRRQVHALPATKPVHVSAPTSFRLSSAVSTPARRDVSRRAAHDDLIDAF